MYLDHFKLNTLPFSLTPNTRFLCRLENHQAILDMLLFCTQNEAGFVKVTGEVGTGKTLLCRELLNQLGKSMQTIYLPNPDFSAVNIRRAIAKELGIAFTDQTSQQHLVDLIFKKVLALSAEGKETIILIDEAQTLPDESLEALRLLTNLETESKKLLQVVLFGQPELDKRLAKARWRQLRQRIVFSHQLKPMKKSELNDYLSHRLGLSGNTRKHLFTRRSKRLLYHASQGIPRIMNILCHKSLILTYACNRKKVTAKMMRHAIADSKEIVKRRAKKMPVMAILFLIVGIGISFNQAFFSLIPFKT